MTARSNQSFVGIGYNLGIGQLDQTMVMFNQPVSVEVTQAFCVNQQVLFDLITNHLGQNQLADPGGAEGQGCLIKSPGRNDASRKNI